MSCCTLIAFPKDGLSCESNLEKIETERVSENVRVKVSSIRPGVYPTVMHSQQREEARVSVCLVAGDTGPSLYMAVKLATRVTFDKKGKKSRACMHTFFSKDGSMERLVAQWSFSVLIFPQEPADVADWSLCENYLCFRASDKFNISVPALLSVSVASRRTLRWCVGGEGF